LGRPWSGFPLIKPDGTDAWNSCGGKSGRWVRDNAAFPVVLINTMENRQ
jgi:hypothetical protein